MLEIAHDRTPFGYRTTFENRTTFEYCFDNLPILSRFLDLLMSVYFLSFFCIEKKYWNLNNISFNNFNSWRGVGSFGSIIFFLGILFNFILMLYLTPQPRRQKPIISIGIKFASLFFFMAGSLSLDTNWKIYSALFSAIGFLVLMMSNIYPMNINSLQGRFASFCHYELFLNLLLLPLFFNMLILYISIKNYVDIPKKFLSVTTDVSIGFSAILIVFILIEYIIRKHSIAKELMETSYNSILPYSNMIEQSRNKTTEMSTSISNNQPNDELTENTPLTINGT